MSSTPHTAPEHAHEHAPHSPKPAEKINVVGTVETTLAAADTSHQVGELMGTIESVESAEASEGAENKTFSESEDTSKGKKSSGGTTTVTPPVKPTAPLPPPAQMTKEVIVAIRTEIRKEQKEVLKVYIGWHKVSPKRLAEMLTNIRKLKDLLSFALEAIGDALTGMYRKWVLKESV